MNTLRVQIVLLCCLLGYTTGADVYNLAMIDWIANFPPGLPPATFVVPIQLHTGKLFCSIPSS